MTAEVELCDLLAAVREDTLTAEEGRRLEQMLRESDEAVAAYVRSVALQADLYGCLVRWAKRDGPGTDTDSDRATSELFFMPTVTPEPAAEFQDTLYGKSVFDDALRPHADDEEEPLTVPSWPPVAPVASAAPGRIRAWAGAGIAAAALLLLAFSLWSRSQPADVTPTHIAAATHPAVAVASELAPLTPVMPPTSAPAPAPLPPPPVVATFRESVDAVWEAPADDPIAAGALLRAGRLLHLTRGFARLSFAGGADVVVEGPARLTLESGSRLTLARGRLTANVPEAARGFTVATPLLDVVDLGTEFGVNVDKDHSVDVPVFVGHVQARPSAAPDGEVIDVRAGQAGRAKTADDVQVGPAGTEAADFVRDIRNIRMPLPARGTGEGLKIGDADSRWQIVSLSTDANWKPRDAVVCGPGPRGLANDDRSAWVSANGERAPVAGGRYAFVTTFDLARFEPATARLRIRLAVDDFVREVRLNDRMTEIKLARPGTEAKDRLHDFDIADGFVSGTNRLEIVIENGHGAGPRPEPNPMGLRVELSGTAVRKLDGR